MTSRHIPGAGGRGGGACGRQAQRRADAEESPDSVVVRALRVPLRDLAGDLLRDDLRAMTDGQVAGLSRLRCAGSDSALSWVGDAAGAPVDAATLLRLCQSPPDLGTGSAAEPGPADVDAIMAERMVSQYRSYLYYAATMMEVFCTGAERVGASMANARFPVELLAHARAHLAVDHIRSWRLVDSFRAQWGLAVIDRQRPAPAEATGNGRTPDAHRIA
ncbi:hypothetical protein AB0J82_33430 [Asanoa sp. NPDC049518]|uniref:hypothetical protein n=1 Tax=unclassified Asanoa TaxID=2685164 RepID=UPI00342B33C6